MKGHSSQREPLAIVGMACRFPGADDTQAFWGNILEGKDCISEIPETHWNPDDYFDPDPKKADHTYAKRGGFINPQDFNPLAYGIPPKALEATDTSQLLGLMVAAEALEDAGYGKDREFDRERVSVILGVTGTLELVIPLGARLGHPVWRKALLASGLNEEQTEAIVQKIADGFVPWQEQSFPGLLGNVVAGRIANFLDLGGTNCVSDAACASALSAINLAAMELWTGKVDMVLTGGIDTFNDIFMYMCFSKTPALSPSGDARPFSAEGDGTILGEGAGILALKRLSDAERDGDRIYAVLRSVGSSSDGRGNAIYAPAGKGQKRALRRAYEQAEVTPDSIELIEGHGTGTKVGDAVELTALDEVFRESGEGRQWCAVGSIKSQIGHTKAAAGAAGLMKAVLALKHKVLPPSIKVDKPLPTLQGDGSPLYLNNTPSPWTGKRVQPRRAGVSAFGFGGSNFHCVVEEYGGDEEIYWDDQVQILAFCEESRENLQARLRGFDLERSWQDLGYTAAEALRAFDGSASCRLLLVIERDRTDLSKIVGNAVELLSRFADRTHWSSPEGIYFGSGKAPGKLGILFPGQGSQYTGMLRDLATRFPAMRAVLGDVDKAFADCKELSEEPRLTRLIYPPTPWDQETAAEQEATLRLTQNAQPAIGAVSIGALKVLNQFGVKPDAAAGHSYGELTALCAAERFDADALYLLSRLRGKLMAEGDGDRGAMLAVRAPLDRVETFIETNDLDLVMANKNAPSQVVLSGATAEIKRAEGLLRENGLRGKRLPVAAAFHSTLVAQASKPFYSQLKKVEVSKARIPVYANTTGEAYPEREEDMRDLLANQLGKPVEFVKEIENMHADGVHSFLEIGPGGRLTGLVKSILADRDFEAFAVDASSGKRRGTYDLAAVLCQLAALGHRVELTGWEQAAQRQRPEPSKKPVMTVPISGANHVSQETRKRAEAPMKPVLDLSPKTVAKSEPVRKAAPHQISATRAKHAVAPTSQNSEVPSLHKQVTPKPQVTEVSGNSALTAAFEANRQNIAMLQQMQTETARLHAQFLQGQEQAQQTLQRLMAQQEQALLGQLPMAPLPTAAPVVPAVTVAPQPVAQPVSVKTTSVVAPQPIDVKTPTVSQTTSSGVDTTRLEKALIAVVGEKTGYPEEMLETGMSLDADLGIDSIKRVEIFSSLQEAMPGLPAIEPDRMGTLQTLADIVACFGEAVPAVPETTSASSHGAEELTTQLMTIVSDKTGYPTDMLELGMSLDADLGIDSIKRVEIFSALQEAMPSLPSVEPDQMSGLQTLADIVAHLGAVPTIEPVKSGIGRDEIARVLLAVVADKTGYPTDMLEAGMSLDADLGIDSIKRVEVLSALAEQLPGLPDIKPDEAGSFQTLGDIIEHLTKGAADVVVAPASRPSVDMKPVLMEIVSEKTGYPVDLLELEMNLDADLGIDSIKRVEIFSAIQEQYPHLPEVKPDQIGAFGTLGDVLEFLQQDAGTEIVEEMAVDGQRVQAALMAIVAEKTGYPEDMLELSMSLEGDLGIDSIKRVEILSGLAEALPELPEPKPDELAPLQTLGEIAGWFADRGSVTEDEAPATSTMVPAFTPVSEEPGGVVRSLLRLSPLSGGSERLSLHGESPVWVTADGGELSEAIARELAGRGLAVCHEPAEQLLAQEVPEHLNGIVITETVADDKDTYLEQALLLAKHVQAPLCCEAREHGAFLVSVTRMDGAFGLSSLDRDDLAVNGALAGLVKTARHEWPEVSCKALDADPSLPLVQVGERVVHHCLCTGPAEVALGEIDQTLSLEETSLPEAEATPIEPGSLVLISGGARGVTATCALELARRFQPHLVLLGRSAYPGENEASHTMGITDEGQLKKAILAGAQSKMNPKELQEAYRRLLGEREMRSNLQAMREAGATVTYLSVDLRDRDSVHEALAPVVEEHGPVRGLVHGAGVLADRLIADKTAEQFRMVYETKVGGLRNLLAHVDESQLRLVAFFSSSTGRFGRTGQVDYAMANEVLNKTAAVMQRRNPESRVVSVNWGPWDGGMVTPELKRLFASEGIDVIPQQAGATYLVDELTTSPGGPVEIVILGGQPEQKPVREEEPIRFDTGELVFELDVNLANHPFLRAHVIGGKAVVPTVMFIEWLGHAAVVQHMGYRFHGLRQFKILKGVTLDADETVQLQFAVNEPELEGERLVVPVTCFSMVDGKRRPHASGRMVLDMADYPAGKPTLQVPRGEWTETRPYYDILFHGPRFQGLTEVTGYSDQGIAATAKTAERATEWMPAPLRRDWLADPLAIDSAFQMMVLWTHQQTGLPNLPTEIAELSLYGRFPKDGDIRMVASVTEHGSHKAMSDIELIDSDGQLLARLSGYACVLDASLTEAYSRNRLLQEMPN